MTRSGSLATFWALSDPIRVDIVDRIAAGSAVTVTQLAAALPITRQAVSRHIKTLESAGLLIGSQDGREHRFRVDAEPLAEATRWLHARAASWDRALGRLTEFLESP